MYRLVSDVVFFPRPFLQLFLYRNVHTVAVNSKLFFFIVIIIIIIISVDSLIFFWSSLLSLVALIIYIPFSLSF
jgi:hypothetical protein